MNQKIKKVISIFFLLMLCLQSVSFAATPPPPLESSRCIKPITSQIIAPHHRVTCGYLLNLYQQQNTYRNEIITQENLLRSYEKQLQAYRNSTYWSTAGAVADSITIAVSLIGTPVSLGSLSAVDAFAAASLATNLADIADSTSAINSIKIKAQTATAKLSVSVSNYNSKTNIIRQHVNAMGSQCQVVTPYEPIKVTVSWPKVTPVY